MTRYVYLLGAGEADGRGDQISLLGGKGAGLAEMTNLGIPVPPGFTLTTEVCNYFHSHEQAFPKELAKQVDGALERVGELMDMGFGDPDSPLLLSVRPGAPVSMPGMMETVLNLGLNDSTVQGLAARTGDVRFAYDCYRRFVATYGEVVMGVTSGGNHSPFAAIRGQLKADRGVDSDTALTAEDLKSLVTQYKIEILRTREVPFPEDPKAQLWGAIGAVLQAWQNPRAQAYRRTHDSPANMGTAVNVQAMVFGNMGEDSAVGVASSRDPMTGEQRVCGEFLVDAQGEELVAGTRESESIDKLAERMPEVHAELLSMCERLETHFCDMQDLEFTVQQGHLWLLQTRGGKRTGQAMVRVAVDMVHEGLIGKRAAILRVEPSKLGELIRPTLNPDSQPEPLTQGLPAAPGAAVGRVVFNASDAWEWVQRGDSVILVRVETGPEDLRGLQAAAGILTARGGMTSHAAVVARGLGKGCVAGCAAIKIDMSRERFAVGSAVIKKGDVIALDGDSGAVFTGFVALAPAPPSEYLQELMSWVDEHRRLKVRGNADTPVNARTARAFGAEGIGLCRTEHLFFEPRHLLLLRQMILASDEAGRRAALDTILPLQRDDFIDIFRTMDGSPVTIRLLDSPLHEFLPATAAEIADVAREMNLRPDELASVVQTLREANPMLGHRGCRLAINFPEIYEMQTRAVAEAAIAVMEAGGAARPEIMIPFVSVPEELRILREHVTRAISDVLESVEVELACPIGTMIELPRACLVGDKIAEHADFFSFGTNDLTQATYGISRDDASRFLPTYVERDLIGADPFVVLDRHGVGVLIRIAVEKGRAKKTKLKIGICGEHGGEPHSIEFCHREGFDYVSCSPFRVPIARVAAAQAALRREARGK